MASVSIQDTISWYHQPKIVGYSSTLMWFADLLASGLKGDLETQNGSNHVQTHTHRVNFYIHMQVIVQEKTLNWKNNVDPMTVNKKMNTELRKGGQQIGVLG
jgi:hypothetical protein